VTLHDVSVAVGDCGAVDQIFSKQHYNNSAEAAATAAVEAGVDWDCYGPFVSKFHIDSTIPYEFRSTADRWWLGDPLPIAAALPEKQLITAFVELYLVRDLEVRIMSADLAWTHDATLLWPLGRRHTRAP
jgi:hypothetical protein